MKIYSDRITRYTHTGRLNGELINILELDYINSPDALNEQQIIFFKFFTLQFKIWKVWKLWVLRFTGFEIYNTSNTYIYILLIFSNTINICLSKNNLKSTNIYQNIYSQYHKYMSSTSHINGLVWHICIVHTINQLYIYALN